MKKIDKFFDINIVLMTVFVSLERLRESKNIEIIYDIDPTIPKELKGDEKALTHILIHMLETVLEKSEKSEILLSLHAPKNFIYEESISFVIEDTKLSNDAILKNLESKIESSLNAINGQIIYNENGSDMHISIPFKLKEIGDRRYYRLPDISMLGKKVLLISNSNNVSTSLQKMFKYFLYNVDIDKESYIRRGEHLGYYDIFIIDEVLVNDELEKAVKKVQSLIPLKYVILRTANEDNTIISQLNPYYLIKPVVQESIFDMIVSLYKNELDNRAIRLINDKSMTKMDRCITEAFHQSDEITPKHETIQMEQKDELFTEVKENPNHYILNTDLGMKNTQKFGLLYKKELQNFIDDFSKSDVYFRDIVQTKALWQIKEFCIDLEKKANLIGAQKVAYIAEQVNLLFVYDKIDNLSIFASKYHVELKYLIDEIKTYLNT